MGELEDSMNYSVKSKIKEISQSISAKKLSIKQALKVFLSAYYRSLTPVLRLIFCYKHLTIQLIKNENKRAISHSRWNN